MGLGTYRWKIPPDVYRFNYFVCRTLTTALSLCVLRRFVDSFLIFVRRLVVGGPFVVPASLLSVTSWNVVVTRDDVPE